MEVLDQQLDNTIAQESQDSIIRPLLSCKTCGNTLRAPVTTRCGLSHCRQCILNNFTSCPADDCRFYSIDDCPIDVTLQQTIDLIQSISATLAIPSHDETDPSGIPMFASDQNLTPSSDLPFRHKSASIHHIAGDNTIETVDNRNDKWSNLLDDKEIMVETIVESGEHRNLVNAVSARFPDETNMIICQICYHILLEPVTTRCGHTFCRHCLSRSIDTSQNCPTCRTEFPWLFPSGPLMSHDPLRDWASNDCLNSLISICWPKELAMRRSVVISEESIVPRDMEIPLFVCCLSFPQQPTYLRIFEPRYRLMLRRVLNTESKTFGMVSFNRQASPPMARYGTLLKVERVVYTEERAILLKTVGLTRFKVSTTAQRDGYWVATTTALSDDTPETEVPLESQEVGFLRALDPALRTLNFDPENITLSWAVTAISRNSRVLKRLMTKELLDLAMEYVQLIQTSTPPTIQQNIIAERGSPPELAADFTWWFAAVMKMGDDEGLKLLKETSPRTRMKLIVTWVAKKLRPGYGTGYSYSRFLS